MWVPECVCKFAMTESVNPLWSHFQYFRWQFRVEAEASALAYVRAQRFDIVIHGEAVCAHRLSIQCVSGSIKAVAWQPVLSDKMRMQCFTGLKVLHADFTPLCQWCL